MSTVEKVYPHQYTDYSATSLESVIIMDLDAYNYISAFLFEGMGTEEMNLQTLDNNQRQALFREDLLKSKTC